MTPVTVAPQERRLVPLDELADLRAHERVDVPCLVGILGVGPVEQRVVATEHVISAAHGVRELGHDVALGPELH